MRSAPTRCAKCGRSEYSIICSLCKTPKDWKPAPRPQPDQSCVFDFASELEKVNKFFKVTP